MASQFPEEGSRTPCQGTDCTKTAGVTYRVEENQALCEECVCKKAGSVKPKVEWICDEHDEPIKYFCRSHNEEACQLCATIFHQGCDFDAAKTVLKQVKNKLSELQSVGPQKLDNFEKRRHHFVQTKHEVETHLVYVVVEVGKVVDLEVKKEKDNEQARAVEIEREAEEEIKKIKANMEERLRRNQENGEALRCLLEEKRILLISDVEKCGKNYETFVEECINMTKDRCKSLQDKLIAIAFLCEREDRDVLQGSRELISNIEVLIQEDDMEVHFEETSVHAKTTVLFHPEHKSITDGRIDGFFGMWKLEETIPIVIVNTDMPIICGCLSDHEIVFREIAGNDLYLTNLKTKEIILVEHEGHGTVRIEECVPLNEHQVVCLNVRNWRNPRMGDTGDHFISVFDRSSWQMVGDLPCPWTGCKRSHIDVDKDGNVLAAREGERTVHIINPKTSTITQTTPWSKQNGSIMGRIHALSSKDIVAKIHGYHGGEAFNTFNREGVMKCSVRDDDWNCYTSRYTVDPLTGILYITYQKGNVKMVDQVYRDGTFIAKRIVKTQTKNSSGYAAHSYIIPSGRMVTTDGKNILVYKK